MRYAVVEKGAVVTFLYPAAELPAHKLHAGLLPVAESEDPIPEGKRVASYTYTVGKDFVTVVPVLEDIPVPPVFVPETMHKLYVMRALKAAGKWDDLKALLASNSDADDEWEATTNVRRDHPLVLGLAQSYGWGDTELDALFLAAQAAERAA
jgi:hypothetical protein